MLNIPKFNLFLPIYFSEIEFEEMAKIFPNLVKTIYAQVQEDQQNPSKLKTNHTKMYHNQIAGNKKQR